MGRFFQAVVLVGILLLVIVVGIGVDSLVHGFELRSSCGLGFDFGLKSGCDCDGRLWVVGKLLSSCFILFCFFVFLPGLLSWEERGLPVMVGDGRSCNLQE